MSTIGPITPPYPTDSAGPASDPQPASTYSPEQDLNDRLTWAQGHKDDLGQLLSDLDDRAKNLPKSMAWAAKGIGWLLHGILDWEIEWKGAYFNAISKLVISILPDAETLLGEIFAAEFPVFEQVITSAVTPNVEYGGGAMADIAQIIFQSMVQPFSLIGNAANPTQLGSGIENQQYLLGQSLGLAVATWAIDSIAQFTGGGVLRTLWPIMNMISQAVNPYNAVRMAMEYGYRFFIQQPLTRDMNHAYPIKDLGLSALAKLYIRGEITEDVYLSRCLDSGLDNTQAGQLIVESQKMLSEGDLAKLHALGIMSAQDVLDHLKQMGYPPGTAEAVLYLQTHARYFTYQERVGNEAVDAWKHGYITQARLEQILPQLGFSQDEIQLLEIEGEFTKGQKGLSYSQVKQMYEANLVDLNYVINFLSTYEGVGYRPQDIQNLVLLDFTAAVEKQARAAELLARLRTTAESDRVSAATEAAKNETALANAKKKLADQIDAEAKLLGTLESLPGIVSLIGGIP